MKGDGKVTRFFQTAILWVIIILMTITFPFVWIWYRIDRLISPRKHAKHRGTSVPEAVEQGPSVLDGKNLWFSPYGADLNDPFLRVPTDDELNEYIDQFRNRYTAGG